MRCVLTLGVRVPDAPLFLPRAAAAGVPGHTSTTDGVAADEVTAPLLQVSA